jgi:hypothetical protein
VRQSVLSARHDSLGVNQRAHDARARTLEAFLPENRAAFRPAAGSAQVS